MLTTVLEMRLFFVLPLLLTGAAGQTPPVPSVPIPTGGIQGILVDEAGAPVSSAFVIASRIGPTGLGKSSQSGQGGTFSVPNLPDGSYTLCVNVPGKMRVDPCVWSATPTTAVVSGGKISTGNRLVAKKSSTLSVRIQDPGHMSSARSSTTEPPQILLGVVTPAGTTSPAILASTDQTGRTYQIMVGLDLPLTFIISAKHLKIVDEGGFPVQDGGTLRGFQHTTGAASQPSFTYTVVGRTN